MILAVTSGRADYTPMSPVLEKIEHRHLNVEYAQPYWAVKMVQGRLEKEKYDAVLLLGDRYETLGAALAATYMRVPIAHIHGGEASFGSFDNQIRDAITKLAHIHFVAAEPMRQRLLDLGEEEHRIHVVGAPGLDNLTDLPERKPGKYFVVTYHPATLGGTNIDPLLDALREFPNYECYWSTPNNDPEAEIIWAALETGYTVNYAPSAYVNDCRHAAAVVGNSSSGLIEAPTLEVPTVNVGPRQDGRLRGPSVFDCAEDQRDIVRALRQALEYDGPFDNPYGEPGASEKIAHILKTTEIGMVKRWRV